MVSATFIIDVGSVLLPWGGYSALPASIHARLRGWARSVCPEQNHFPNLKCMLIVSYIDDSGPDRKLNSSKESTFQVLKKFWDNKMPKYG